MALVWMEISNWPIIKILFEWAREMDGELKLLIINGEVFLGIFFKDITGKFPSSVDSKREKLNYLKN
jgi:hypothetical protein